MHGQYWAVRLLKNSSQAISEYCYCENVYPTFALWSKYPISYQNFRIWNMHTFDQLDSFSNFYFAHDETLKPFFLHEIYRKWIQQCLNSNHQIVQECAENIFYFSFFSSFLHKHSNFILLTFNNYWMRLRTIWRIIKPEVIFIPIVIFIPVSCKHVDNFNIIDVYMRPGQK
jgi:hypothetical protein